MFCEVYVCGLVSVLDVGDFFLALGGFLVYFCLDWIVVVLAFGVLFLFILCALSVFF